MSHKEFLNILKMPYAKLSSVKNMELIRFLNPKLAGRILEILDAEFDDIFIFKRFE